LEVEGRNESSCFGGELWRFLDDELELSDALERSDVLEVDEWSDVLEVDEFSFAVWFDNLDEVEFVLTVWFDKWDDGSDWTPVGMLSVSSTRSALFRSEEKKEG
jgi:hypothetical protein